MKKGFTLIELVGVVIVLALICLLAIPSFLSRIRSTEQEISDAMHEILENATSIYMSNNNYVKVEGDVYCVTIEELVNSNLINSPVKDPITKDEISQQSYVKATVNGGLYDYELTNNCEPSLSNIYYKAKSLVYTDGVCDTTKAYEYMNGCYLKIEANTELKNHVWYNGFLWRIMGINSDGSVRMITEENVTTIPYNVANNTNFEGSHVDNWLNTYFYNKLSDDNNLKTNVIVEGKFCQGAVTTTSSSRTDCTGGIEMFRNVGLLTLDEYNLAGGTVSYLTTNQAFWTMSPYDSSRQWYVSDSSHATNYNDPFLYGIRPVINVKAETIVPSGNGSLSDYYVLGENKKTTDITQKLTNIKVGEYVSFNDKIYRLIESGNISTFILDDYYTSTSTYAYSSTFSTTTGIGQILNTTVLDWLTEGVNQEELKSIILTSNWYQNKFVYGDSYEVSLNEDSVTPIEAQVGLIRIGELLSGQSYSILTQNGNFVSTSSNAQTFWLMNPSSTYNVWTIENSGVGTAYDTLSSFSVRPVINIDNRLVTITGGNGTPNSPYIVTVK